MLRAVKKPSKVNKAKARVHGYKQQYVTFFGKTDTNAFPFI